MCYRLLALQLTPQVVAAVIAIVIIAALNADYRRRNLKVLAAKSALFVGAFTLVLLVTGLVSRVILSRPEVKRGQSANLQYILWTATNPNCDGNFCSESYVKYYAQADPDRAKLVSPALWRHISTMSAERWRHLLWYKVTSTYGDGTFGYIKEGDQAKYNPDAFFVDEYVSGGLGGVLKNLYHDNFGKLIQPFMQSLWLAVLVLCLFAPLGLKRSDRFCGRTQKIGHSDKDICFDNRRKAVVLLLLSLVGIILFELLFEARARYLIVYVPIFVVVATLGLNNLARFQSFVIQTC